MKPMFHVTRADSPHIVLFSADSLEAIAESLAAQPDPTALSVYAGGDFTRDLNASERRRLDELTGQARAAAP
jgi:hypothetical protein